MLGGDLPVAQSPGITKTLQTSQVILAHLLNTAHEFSQSVPHNKSMQRIRILRFVIKFCEMRKVEF
jgi:hypothetical protein